jgi:hypothetical protein
MEGGILVGWQTESFRLEKSCTMDQIYRFSSLKICTSDFQFIADFYQQNRISLGPII